MEHNERDTYRTKVTFQDKRTGERTIRYSKSYDQPGIAKAQGTYLAGRHSGYGVEWISKELQKADWTTVDVIKVP